MNDLAAILFGSHHLQTWEETRGFAESRIELLHSVADDGVLAVGIRGLDLELYHAPSDSSLTAVYLVVLNLTPNWLKGVALGLYSRIVDDLGNQYAPTYPSLYWLDESNNSYSHDMDISPKARLEGLLLFPPLRSDAARFEWWVFHDDIVLKGNLHSSHFKLSVAADNPHDKPTGLTYEIPDEGDDRLSGVDTTTEHELDSDDHPDDVDLNVDLDDDFDDDEEDNTMDLTADNLKIKLRSGPDSDGDVLVAIKVTASNDSDEDQTVYVTVQGVDEDDFEVKDVIVSGDIPADEKRTLTARFYMSEADYKEVRKWKVSSVS